MGEVRSGRRSDICGLLFQYSVDDGATWVDMKGHFGQKNPTDGIGEIDWDPKGLPDGNYLIRIVTIDCEFGPDPSPLSILVKLQRPSATPGLDPDFAAAFADIFEEHTAGDGAVRETTVVGGREEFVGDIDPLSGFTFGATFMPGSLPFGEADRAVITVPPLPEMDVFKTAMEAAGLTLAGSLFDIKLGSGTSTFTTPVDITMTLPDADGDGLIDGSGIPVSSLAIASSEDGGLTWSFPGGTTTLDPDKGTLTTSFTGFSMFALVQKPAGGGGGGAHGGRCFAGSAAGAWPMIACGLAIFALVVACASRRRRQRD
jgi:hypothetical protein